MSRLALVSLQKDLIINELACGEGCRNGILKGLWNWLIAFLS